jgi:hypothetical protein
MAFVSTDPRNAAKQTVENIQRAVQAENLDPPLVVVSLLVMFENDLSVGWYSFYTVKTIPARSSIDRHSPSR